MTADRRLARISLASALLGVVALLPVAGTEAPFTGTTGTGSTLASNPDWLAPTVSATVIQKTEGYTAGYVRAGGTYRVYANAADNAASNPPSQVGPLSTADVSQLTTGQSANPVSAGATTVGATTYGFRSTTPPTVTAGTTAGTKNYTVTARDQATPSNASTAFAGTVIVDNIVPAPSGLTMVNGGGGATRQPNAGDIVTLTFNDIVETQTVLTTPANWTGTATQATVVISNGVGANDSMTISNSNIGTIDLGNAGYVAGTVTFTNGATTWVNTSATTRSLRIVLGTQTGVSTRIANGQAPTQRWTPTTNILDRAGNRTAATAYIEPGAADNDF